MLVKYRKYETMELGEGEFFVCDFLAWAAFAQIKLI